MVKIIHNKFLSCVEFRTSNFHLFYSIPEKITEIKQITGYDEGFLTMETNYGEEYTYLLDIIKYCHFTESYRKKATKVIKSVKFEDIILEKCD